MLLNDENDTERKTKIDNTFPIGNILMLSQHLYEPFPELPERRSSYLPPKEKKINETTLKLKLSIRRPNNPYIFLEGRLNCLMLLQVNLRLLIWRDSFRRMSTDNIQFSFQR